MYNGLSGIGVEADTWCIWEDWQWIDSCNKWDVTGVWTGVTNWASIDIWCSSLSNTVNWKGLTERCTIFKIYLK